MLAMTGVWRLENCVYRNLAIDKFTIIKYNPFRNVSSHFVTFGVKMTKPHEMAAPKMTRVTVRVPKLTLEEINQWVDGLGVRRSHFLALALVAGARSLMHACAFEPPDPAEPPFAELPASDQVQVTVDDTIPDLQAQIVALTARIQALQDVPVDSPPTQTEV